MRPSVASTAVRVRADDDQAHRLGAAHDRPVAFHAHDAVDDRHRLGQRSVDVEHRFGNAGVVQHVLRPAVLDAGHRAVQVLQRRRLADPMVRLHLGHRDDQVGFDHLAREVEPGQRAARPPFFTHATSL